MSTLDLKFIEIESIYAAVIQNKAILLYFLLSAMGLIIGLWFIRKVLKKKPRENKTPEQKATVLTQTKTVGKSTHRPISTPKQTLTEQIKNGLSKTRQSLWGGFEDLISGKVAFDRTTLEKLHESLYRSDLGVQTTDKIIKSLKNNLENKTNPSWLDLKEAISQKAEEILSEPNTPLKIGDYSPCVILVVGVNGVGKTTTIGKLASHLKSLGKTVLLAAADTYRAAAIEQLTVWGERLDMKVVAHQANADPAAVAYDAVKSALARKVDVLLIDTAGRLHNKDHLMKELNKINRVLAKDLPNAPHETFLVLDATVGQNAFAQVEAFKEIVDLTGIVVTKLDGTAKGGVVIGLADRYKIPIRFIGVGEKAEDLKPFVARDFAESIMS